MAVKKKYDVSGVEPTDYDTPVPVGLYQAKITEAERGPSKSSGRDQVALTMEVVNSDGWDGRNLWDYIGLDEASEWKFAQFVNAIEAPAKGDIDKLVRASVGQRIQVRVKHQTDSEYGTRARVAALLPMPEGVGAEDVDDDDDEPVQADDAGGDDGDDEWTMEDLEELDREELEELVEDEDLDVKFNGRTKDDVLRERVAEALGIEDEDDDDDDADDDDEDYESMDLAALKATAKERGLSAAGSKKSLIRRLEKDDAADDDDEPF